MSQSLEIMYQAAVQDGYTGCFDEWKNELRVALKTEPSAVKIAGIATAYGAAVRGGYAGSYDDFCDYMYRITQSIETVEAAADAAQDSAGDAGASAEQAAASAELAQRFVGAPRTANSAADMTDQSLIYVYTGTTTGAMTIGHWYYYDGSAWADGGVYNSTAFSPDTAPTEGSSNVVTSGGVWTADEAIRGDVAALKSALNETEVLLDVPIKSGKLYGYVTPGNQYSISDNANSYYTDLIDVSELVGGTLKIQMSAVGTGSRCFGFCNSNGIVSNIFYSSDANQFELDAATGLYVCETKITDVRFFFSSSKVAVKILISAMQKNEIDISEIKVQSDITNKAFELGSVDYSPVYTNRSMNDTTGAQSDNAPKIASTPGLYYVPIHCNVLVSYYNITDYSAKVYCYDENKSYLGVLGTSAVILNNNLSLLNNTRYLRFLVLRKDNTNITSQEAAQAITFTATYDGRVKVLEDVVGDIESSSEVTSDIIPSIPYKVFHTLDGYDAERPKVTDDFYSVYVDSMNGNDTNDGTDGNPVKTLSRAVYLARVQMDNNSKDTVIHVADNSVFYYDDIPDNYSVSKSFAIIAPTKATVFAGKKPTFTQSGNHYVSEALTSYTPIGVLDIGQTDDYGLFVPLSKAESENAVDSSAGSYYIDSTNKIIYVRPFANSNINNIVVIFSDRYAMNPSASGFTRSSFVYLKNITFVGNSTATGRAAATVGETIIRTIYIDGCTFQHGFTNNVVSFNDFDYTYIVNSLSGYAKYDCYNYHFTKKPTPTAAVVVEVNDVSKEAGYYNTSSGFSDNLTTCHEGANILRCGSHGYNANGGMCADVDGCYSVCIDCTFANTSYADTAGINRAPYYFADTVSGPRSGKSVLQNCFGYDSRNNKMVEAVDLLLSGNNSGGTISATKITVNK